MPAKVIQKKNLKDVYQNKLYRNDICDVFKNFSYVTRCAENVAKICDEKKIMKLTNYAYVGM